MNNRYIIEVGDPLLRPGMKITTEASERYVVRVSRKLMDLVREINSTDNVSTSTECSEYIVRPLKGEKDE